MGNNIMNQANETIVRTAPHMNKASGPDEEMYFSNFLFERGFLSYFVAVLNVSILLHVYMKLP